MKRKIFLLTGFQNWGKSYIIANKEGLFKQSKFAKNKLYELCGKFFCVQSQSNDDLGKVGYINAINSRLEKLKEVGIKPEYIISAFCPTKEDTNDSKAIINELFKNDEVYLITLEYKWCQHAKLNIGVLESYYSDIDNCTIINIDEKNADAKVNIIREEIEKLI